MFMPPSSFTSALNIILQTLRRTRAGSFVMTGRYFELFED